MRTSSGNLCQVPSIGFPADITDPLFIDDTDAGSITARNPLGKIDWFLLLRRVPTPAAEVTLLRDLSSAVLTGDRRNHFTTMGAFHLFLLEMEILDEPFDIPLVPFYLVKKLSGPFIWKETIEVVALPGKEGIEINLLCFSFFRCIFGGFLLFFFHKNHPVIAPF